MARIGIVTCSNCTQDLDCASTVCLGDMRKRKGFFEEYPPEEAMDLVGIINCAGCPTICASDKILRRIRSIAELKVDAIHFSYCMTALCPFINKYKEVIQKAYPDLKLIMGTHRPRDNNTFREEVHGLLCGEKVTMADLIKGRPVPGVANGES